MTKYRVRLRDKSIDVELDELRGNTLSFRVEGERYETSIERVFEQTKRNSTRSSSLQSPVPSKSPSISASQMPGDVTAPMPGIIVSVLVKKDQKVKAGDVVAVMEAMKMENNIAATTAGVVKEIRVTAGQEVKGGEVLAVIEG